MKQSDQPPPPKSQPELDVDRRIAVANAEHDRRQRESEQNQRNYEEARRQEQIDVERKRRADAEAAGRAVAEQMAAGVLAGATVEESKRAGEIVRLEFAGSLEPYAWELALSQAQTEFAARAKFMKTSERTIAQSTDEQLATMWGCSTEFARKLRDEF